MGDGHLSRQARTGYAALLLFRREVVVMPSLYGSFGMVALEAMAAAHSHRRVGGLGYLVQDGLTGYTIPDSDPQALSDKLSTFGRFWFASSNGTLCRRICV